MSPSPRSAGAVLALALLAADAPARAQAVLDVAGSVLTLSPRLEVRVVVTNRGDRPAAPLELTGALLGQERAARLPDGVAPGAEGSVVLAFDAAAAEPGVHALTLLLEYPVEGAPDAAGNPPLASVRAWLLLALGANPEPPARIEAAPSTIDVRGTVEVSLESADGRPRRVRLRALPARGLRVEGEPAQVELPAAGPVRTRLTLVRAGAARGTRHAILLVAEASDGGLARASVATATIEVAPDPALLPRLRLPLAVLGGLLLAFALGHEAWRRRAPAHGA